MEMLSVYTMNKTGTSQI